MGEHERIEDLTERIERIIKCGRAMRIEEIAREIAGLIYNREKALHKIIAAIAFGHASISSIHAKARGITIPGEAFSKDDTDMNIDYYGDGVGITVWLV